MANQVNMSAPPPGMPPLAPGWTEHVGPQGQLYWHNASLQQSTYVRPSLGLVAPTTGNASSSTAPEASNSSSNTANKSDKKKKKEKPAVKTPIPGAPGWLRVLTTHGNIFYAHAETSRSEWTVPPEIAGAVQALEAEERASKLKAEDERREAERVEAEEQARKEKEAREERERALEMARREQEERIKALQEIGKRKRGETLDEEEEDGKLEQGVDADELLAAPPAAHDEQDKPSKRAKVDDGAEQKEEEEEDDEAWQLAMAAEMAADAEAAEQQEAASIAPPPQPAAAAAPIPLNIPPPPPGGYTGPPPTFIVPNYPPPAPLAPRVELSLEEAKALFMRMLSTLNDTPNEVNPMAPWDRELPKFVGLADYAALSQLRDRQDAFNEWCKLRLREKRRAKTAGAGAASTSTAAAKTTKESTTDEAKGTSAPAPAQADTLSAYRALLEKHVTSTRTRWDDFRKTWKKERAFFAHGRSDTEREKEFRKWLRELGERKRLAAEKAERDFLNLLDALLPLSAKLESSASKEAVNEAWSKAKRTPSLDRDARYEAVGSSSLRAELFGKWAKGEARLAAAKEEKSEDVGVGGEKGKERDAAKALREREERVRKEQAKVQSVNRRALGAATHDESVIQFGQLLIDQITNPLTTYSAATALLSSDERFAAPGLAPREKEALFNAHLFKLDALKREALFRLFEKHAKGLDVRAETAVPLVRDDEEMERAGLEAWTRRECERRRMGLEELFEEWKRGRVESAKKEFFGMLQENSFVSFWGNLRKERARKEAAGEDADGVEKNEDDDEEGAAGDDGSLLRMAASIDLEELHAVLGHDARYAAFKHDPKQREAWIREHLANLAGLKKTVFQRDAPAA